MCANKFIKVVFLAFLGLTMVSTNSCAENSSEVLNSISFRIKSELPGNIVYFNQPVEVLLNFRQTENPLYLSLSYTVKNYYDTKITEGTKSIVLEKSPPLSIVINHPKGQNGFFFVEFVLSLPFGQTKKYPLTYAVIQKIPPDINDEDSNFGWYIGNFQVKPQYEEYGSPDIRSLRAAGVKWLRVPFVWEWIEPGKGNFSGPNSWPLYDNLLKIAAENKMKVLPNIGHPPKWIFDDRSNLEEDWGANLPKSTTELKNLGNFVFTLVDRYKDKLKYWEFWNEPNSPVVRKQFTGKQFAESLKIATLSAKAADNKAKIMISPSVIDLDFYQSIFKNGSAEYMDVLGVHSYTLYYPTNKRLVGFEKYMLEDLKLLRKMAATYGIKKDVEVWSTEVAYEYWDSGIYRPHIGTMIIERERDEVNFLAKMITVWAAYGCQKIFFQRDLFFKPDLIYNPRPQYAALSTIVNILHDARYIGRIGNEPIHAHFFQKSSGKKILIAWSNKKDKKIQLNFDSKEISLKDIMGNEKKVKTKNGNLILSLSPVPFYIENIGPNLK